MFAYIWPIALVVLSNVLYQIAAKSTPEGIHPLASLTVSYLIAAVLSAVLYFALTRGGNIFAEYSKLNWSAIVIGIVLVGLEAGAIFAYKAGWEVSVSYIVQSAFIAVALLAVGILLFHEPVKWTKIVGLVVCLGGLVLLNL